MQARALHTALVILTALALLGCGRRESAPPLTASRVEKTEFNSKALSKTMKVNVYLPKGYTASQRYPVLYLYHGFGGNQDAWGNKGVFQRADALIDQGDIQPIIIVTPQTDNGFGINSASQVKLVNPADPNESPYLGKYEDYLAEDVIQWVDRTYSTIRSREGRWVGGNSMGGYESLFIAFRHKDLFSRVGSHSGAIWTDATFKDAFVKEWLYPARLRPERDLIEIARSKDLKDLQVYMDCGKQDSYRFYEGMAVLQDVLTGRDVKSESHLNEGDHSDRYLNAHLDEYLRFYAHK